MPNDLSAMFSALVAQPVERQLGKIYVTSSNLALHLLFMTEKNHFLYYSLMMIVSFLKVNMMYITRILVIVSIIVIPLRNFEVEKYSSK